MSRPETTRCSSFVLLTAGIFLLSGCALQSGTTLLPSTASTSSTGATASIKATGKSMGGELPIVGAAVTLYASTSAGVATNGVYTGAATILATTTSGPGGSFNFTGLTNCPQNQIIYIASAGGDNGSGTNANILNVAVLGQCSDNTGTGLPAFTVVNEVTSVATAYAFSGFMTITGTTVNISAPLVNASFASNDVTSGTATTASGLLHAYQNAINLANMTTGAANANPPGSASAIAPAAVVNTLANVLQSCVNTNGGTGTGTPCASLYAATPSLTGATATTTLGAALNLARNPAANVSTLFGLAPNTGAAPFLPTLSQAPKDWTLAIAYPVPANPYTGLGFPFTVALDADDNVYVTSPENDPYVVAVSGGSGVATTTRTSNSACLFGFSSNGTLLPTVVPYSGTPALPGVGTTPGSSSWYCTPNTAGTTASTAPTLLTQLATDALGNVFITNPASSSNLSEDVAVELSKSTGFATPATFAATDTFPFKAIAIDKLNNVYLAHQSSSSSTQSVFDVPAGSSATTVGQGLFNGTGSANQLGSAANWIALDSSGNLWATELADTSFSAGTIYPKLDGAVAINLNLGGVTPYSAAWSGKAVGGGSTTSGQVNSDPYGIALDGSGKPWATLDSLLNGTTSNTFAVGVTPVNVSGTTLNTTVQSWAITNLGLVYPKWLEADGGNVLWIADVGGIVACTINDAASPSPTCLPVSELGGFNPCIPSAGPGSASCAYPDNSSTKGIAIDSTGSVWWTTPNSTPTATSNMLIQMIGTGTPTWPLLATQKPGTMPQ
jgi:hypothetical protein